MSIIRQLRDDSNPRKYFHESGSGRIDSEGVEWWKCDGIGAEDWFRWQDGTLIHLDTGMKVIFFEDRLQHDEYVEIPYTGNWETSNEEAFSASGGRLPSANTLRSAGKGKFVDADGDTRCEVCGGIPSPDSLP